jgi:hypothetical protein
MASAYEIGVQLLTAKRIPDDVPARRACLGGKIIPFLRECGLFSGNALRLEKLRPTSKSGCRS